MEAELGTNTSRPVRVSCAAPCSMPASSILSLSSQGAQWHWESMRSNTWSLQRSVSPLSAQGGGTGQKRQEEKRDTFVCVDFVNKRPHVAPSLQILLKHSKEKPLLGWASTFYTSGYFTVLPNACDDILSGPWGNVESLDISHRTNVTTRIRHEVWRQGFVFFLVVIDFC